LQYWLLKEFITALKSPWMVLTPETQVGEPSPQPFGALLQ
jgi:hypothetical protein